MDKIESSEREVVLGAPDRVNIPYLMQRNGDWSREAMTHCMTSQSNVISIARRKRKNVFCGLFLIKENVAIVELLR